MIGVVLLSVFIVLLCVFIRKVKHAQGLFERMGVPTKPPTFLFGNFGQVILKRHSIAELFDSVYNYHRNTRYVGAYSFTFPVFMLKDPELIKQVTVKDFDHFTDHRPFVPPEVDPVWGKNLLTLKGKQWKDMRATLSPVFTGSKMKQIFTLMNQCAETTIEYFLKHPEESGQIDAKDLFTRFSNDVIATSAFGITLNSLEDKTNNFYTMGRTLTDFSSMKKNLAFISYIAMPRLAKFLNIQVFPKYLGKTFKKIVTDSIKEREEKDIKRPDMIHIMMEAKKDRLKHDDHEDAVQESNFSVVEEDHSLKTHSDKAVITDDDIASQAVIFFFAGFDTVSTVMSFLAYELSIAIDVQKRLQEEIDKHIEENDGKITYDTLAKMKYLDMVISEVLRKWPPTIATDRLCTKPYTIDPVLPGEKPVHIEAGQFISIPNMAIHNDPAHFPDPKKFDPERFNDENRSKIKPYTYMPFSVGPRACIASRFAIQEVKVIFVNLLSKFNIMLSDKSRVPLQLKKTPGSLQVEGGIWFKLSPRQ